MARYRQIYQIHGLFVGPAPGTGYHFIDNDGVLNNEYTGIGHNNNNLIQPLLRIQDASYSFNTERTEIKQLGTRHAISNPVLTHPTVDLSFSYLQMGLLNEARMGFYVNYAQVVDGKSGEPYYLEGLKVPLLSGFYTRSLNRAHNDLKFPYDYRDKRNIFIAVGQEGQDLNKTSYTGADRTIQHTIGFGNAYITSYRTSAAVGDFPRSQVNYLCENMIVQTGAVGQHIPALDAQTKRPLTGIYYSLPSNFTANIENKVLLPGDITLDIISLPKYSGENPISNTGISHGGNFIRFSEYIAPWQHTNVTTQSGFAAPDGSLTAYKIIGTANTGDAYLQIQTSKQSFDFASGEVWEYSVYAKKGNSPYAYIRTIQALDHLTVFDLDNGTGYFDFYNYDAVRNPTIKRVTDDGWYKISIDFFTSGINTYSFRLGQATISELGNRTSGSIGGDVYYWRPQARKKSWVSDYVFTSGYIVTGKDYSSLANITDLGANLYDARIQSYNIDLSMNRDSLNSLTHKLPIDRPINFPVYADTSIGLIMSDDQTGSLANLLTEDRDYNLTIKLNNPYYSTRTGTAIRHDLIRSKLKDLSFSSAIGQNKTANLTFSTELDPTNTVRGWFISGLLNFDGQQTLPAGFMLQENGDLVLQENNDRITIREFTLLY